MKEEKNKKDFLRNDNSGFPFLGGIFKGLGDLIDLADKVSQEGGIIEKQGEFTIPGEKEAKGVYGFTIRTMTGPGGINRPIVQPFGNIKKTPKGPVVEETREPIVDIFEEKDFMRIVTELPGVSEEEIKYEIHGDVVVLSTTGKRKYHKEILLNETVDESSVQSSYKNGMLEIKLKKSK